MQTAVINGTVQYSYVNITQDAIPIWGQCHRRIGNNVVLMIESINSACYRCVHLKLRSRNVLQVNTVNSDFLSKCWRNESLAVCPSEEVLNKINATTEIMLYKKFDAEGHVIRKEYCPIHGKFTFTYDVSDDASNKAVCFNRKSSIDSCPSGSALNLHFQDCSFENNDTTFECLGNWEGRNNQQYLALLGPGPNNERILQYRCAIYHEEKNGSISIAVASDSTCINNLHHALYGHEALHLTPIPQNNWPTEVIHSRCSFPEWLVGKWQHIIVNENTFLYKDHTSFKTYTFKCLARSNTDQTKYSVFSRTQCGEESYNCLWVKQRSTNVMEFQLGIQTNKSYDPDLCSDSNFLPDTWITQARLRKEPGECPVAGEYTGQLPDGSLFCAKLSSDCQAPDTMFYTVSDCSHSQVYEERQYKCLGQWEENGLLYTYTQRIDLAPSFYECFVGSIISDKQINIMEAGEQCQRLKNPLDYGMKLYKQGACYGTHPSPKPVMPLDNNNASNHLTTQSTNYWTPTSVTPYTEFDNGISSSASTSFQKLPIFAILLIIFNLYRLI
ncbi:uncharacterized protein LOC123302749 [Chrysoperla carnea]|uniref:uncharacterized protein LOC123302749 n=1 Tax=Chrysoperla carnea TaxID=189513 RepID=UPI001D05FFDF|nr:uncharacterized protein LOC123302749 [Chrysoperla carnea]